MRNRARTTRSARLLATALASVTLFAACSDDAATTVDPPRTTADPPTTTTSPSTTPTTPTTTTPSTTTPSTTTNGGGGLRGFRLVPFDSCDGFVAYVRAEALERVGPYGLEGDHRIEDLARPTTDVDGADAAESGGAATTAAGAAAAQPTSAGEGSSTTNVQEVGVDEGDLVENDGQRVYSVVDGQLRVVDLAAGAEIASVDLPDGGHQLLLDGSRLAVVSSQWRSTPETTVSVYDVADPAAPALVGRTHLEGEATAVRAADGVARIVLSSPFGERLEFVYPNDSGDEDEAEDENRRVVEEAEADDWLPRAFVEAPNGTTTPPAPALDCAAIGRPEEFSGLGLVWVATVPLGTQDVSATGSAGVVSSGGITYASATTLYVGTSRWVEGDSGPFSPARPEPPRTALHAFDLAAGGPATYVASGEVPGTLLNQFSMSEKDGLLRLAVTESDAGFGEDQQSSVRVLQRDGDVLTEIGAVRGLGPTEEIYAVRFIGDLGYVVTFRQTDPLYVVDLRDPTSPQVAGELKVPGYSAYLHPISDTMLLGIGQDATAEGRRLGTKLSLFDVADPTAPAELATLDVGGESTAEFDHHAFLWWPSTSGESQGQVVVPMMDWQWGTLEEGTDAVAPQSAAVVAEVGEGVIAERGRLTHVGRTEVGAPDELGDPYTEMVQRSMVVGGQLVTVSPVGVLVTDVASLGDLAWIPFA